MNKKKKKLRFPIIVKTILMIFVFSFVVVEISMTYFSIVISKRNKQAYFNIADSLSGTIAQVVDKDDASLLKNKVISILETIDPEDRILSTNKNAIKREEYMNHYDSLYDDTEFVSTFEKVRDQLRTIVDANKKTHIDCAYLSYLYVFTNAKGKKDGLFVYLVDSAPEEDACPPGWLDPVYNANKKSISNPKRGMPAYTTNTVGYGNLITSGSCIMNGEDVVAYACVDVSMVVIKQDQASTIVRLFVYLMFTAIILAIIGVILAYQFFTRPMRKINTVAKTFNDKDPKLSHEAFQNLNVKNRDEIGDLAESLKVIEGAVNERIIQLTAANEALLNAQYQANKMSLLANKDSLTGVQSKIAYDMKVDSLNEQIRNREDIKFGVAMIDLNYLKNTNDEYGHDAGDESLIKLSNIICLAFKHSPVYRIGGDEFVVILTGEDYQHSEELMEEFNERIGDSIKNSKLPLYRRVSAAIGYATYDEKNDKSVDDVFKRADKAMYNRKHQMKEDEQ